MPGYKIDYFFEGTQAANVYGGASNPTWTETWYFEGTASLDTVLIGAALPGSASSRSFVYLRRKILPSLYSIPWVRVSEVGNPRRTKVANIGLRGLLYPNNAVGWAQAAQVNCALLVDFAVLPIAESESVHHRRMLLRGLPTAIIQGNVINSRAPEWKDFIIFLNYLGGKQNGEQISPDQQAARQGSLMMKFTAATSLWLPVTGLGLTQGGRTFTVNVPGLAVPVNADRLLKLRRFIDFPALNKSWRLMTNHTVTTEPISLGRSRVPLFGPASPTLGDAQLDVPAYRRPDQYLIVGLRSKKTGSSPFRQSRGK